MSGVRSEIPAAPAPVEFRYSQTEAFPTVLRQLGASLVITTYKANELRVARARGEGLSMQVRTFDRPGDCRSRTRRGATGYAQRHRSTSVGTRSDAMGVAGHS